MSDDGVPPPAAEAADATGTPEGDGAQEAQGTQDRTAGEDHAPKAADRQPPEPPKKPPVDGGDPDGDDLAVEDELDVALTGDEYRRQQAEIRRIRAASYGSGDAVGGDKITVTVHGTGTDRSWQVSAYARSDVHERRARLVGTSARQRLTELLNRHRVAVLCGRHRSGRKTMALGALSIFTQDIRLVEGRHSPAELTAGVIERGAGYIFDTTGASWADRLREPAVLGCLTTLRECDAYLVLVVAADCETDAVSHLVVHHTPADPLKVLERHLRAGLADRRTGLDADVEEVLRAEPPPRSPAEAADMARTVIRELSDGGRVADALAARPDPRRKAARALLRQHRNGEHEQRDLARRAFLIAWAVLDGLPVVQICRAAQRLALWLYDIESPDRDAKLSQLPFEFGLETWLEYAQENDGTVLSGDGPTGDRLLRMPKGLDSAVLEVVWLDYVVAHEALLEWLRELAGDGDRLVRVKVALALGGLAVHDFEFIAQRFFLGWSRSHRPSLQEVTAWALGEVTKHRPDLRKRVFGMADAWARGQSPPQRLTAIRLYGAHLGVLDPVHAMQVLRSASLRNTRSLRPLITRTVVEIFADGDGAVVARSLAGWAASPQPAVRWMAAECLAELTRLNDTAGRPQLLVLHEKEPALVAALWQRVLSSPQCGGKPWNALRAWDQRGHGIGRLRARLEQDARLRGPLVFYLGRRSPAATASPSMGRTS